MWNHSILVRHYKLELGSLSDAELKACADLEHLTFPRNIFQKLSGAKYKVEAAKEFLSNEEERGKWRTKAQDRERFLSLINPYDDGVD